MYKIKRDQLLTTKKCENRDTDGTECKLRIKKCRENKTVIFIRSHKTAALRKIIKYLEFFHLITSY